MGLIKRFKMKRSIAFPSLAIAVFLFFSHSTGIDAYAQETETLLMLSNNAFSGKAAAWGYSQDRGIKMAAEKLNAGGGIKIGPETYVWEIRSYDNRYIPAESVSVFQHGLAKGCRFMAILGGAVTQPLIPMMNKNKIISLAAIAGGADFTNANNPYLFRTMPSSDLLLSIEGIKLYRTLGVKRLAVIMADNVLGRSDGRILKNALSAQRMSDILVAEEYVSIHTNDFTPVLIRAMAKNPDHIEGGAWPAASLGVLIRQARELGYQGSFSNMTGAPEIEALIETGGIRNIESLVLARVWPPDHLPSRDFQTFWNTYVSRYKESPGANCWESYVALEFLSGAIQETQSLDPDQIVKTMRDYSIQTMIGELRLIGKDHPLLPGYGLNNQFSSPMPMTRIYGGRPVLFRID